MKSSGNRISWLLAILFLSIAVAQPLVADQEKQGKCETLLTQKCEACHYMARICEQLGNKSLRQWKSTIKRMVKHGSKLSKDEQQELALCLSIMPVGAEIVCQ
ncbi:MAG: hypothetical protein KKB30_03045 [Proteobacteria bacterium]|nr:hypothetical protein [Pseudomonadota bacterium]MBU1716078.1 hypothetical protein [Pseudomonadota bacterium]